MDSKLYTTLGVAAASLVMFNPFVALALQDSKWRQLEDLDIASQNIIDRSHPQLFEQSLCSKIVLTTRLTFRSFALLPTCIQ